MTIIQNKVNSAFPSASVGKTPNAQIIASLKYKDENTYQNVEELAKLWK